MPFSPKISTIYLLSYYYLLQLVLSLHKLHFLSKGAKLDPKSDTERLPYVFISVRASFLLSLHSPPLSSLHPPCCEATSVKAATKSLGTLSLPSTGSRSGMKLLSKLNSVHLGVLRMMWSPQFDALRSSVSPKKNQSIHKSASELYKATIQSTQPYRTVVMTVKATS